jgi:hypothetical protein
MGEQSISGSPATPLEAVSMPSGDTTETTVPSGRKANPHSLVRVTLECVPNPSDLSAVPSVHFWCTDHGAKAGALG